MIVKVYTLKYLQKNLIRRLKKRRKKEPLYLITK